MRNFETLKGLLDFIVETSKKDYRDGFYNMTPCESGGYTANPLYVKYEDSITKFYGGEVPFNQMATAWEYNDIYFRACSCVTKAGSTIAFAPDKNTLFDECWCIDINLSIYDLCYDVNKL